MREDDRTSNDSQYTGGHPDYIPIDEATRNALFFIFIKWKYRWYETIQALNDYRQRLWN